MKCRKLRIDSCLLLLKESIYFVVVSHQCNWTRFAMYTIITSIFIVVYMELRIVFIMVFVMLLDAINRESI